MKQQHLQPQFDPTGIPTPPAWGAQPSLGAVSRGQRPGLRPTPSEALACWGYVPSLSIVWPLAERFVHKGNSPNAHVNGRMTQVLPWRLPPTTPGRLGSSGPLRPRVELMCTLGYQREIGHAVSCQK